MVSLCTEDDHGDESFHGLPQRHSRNDLALATIRKILPFNSPQFATLEIDTPILKATDTTPWLFCLLSYLDRRL